MDTKSELTSKLSADDNKENQTENDPSTVNLNEQPDFEVIDLEGCMSSSNAE